MQVCVERGHPTARRQLSLLKVFGSFVGQILGQSLILMLTVEVLYGVL